MNVELTKDELRIYATGLDSSIKIACQQIAQQQSSGAALRELLPTLVKIDQQFMKLDEALAKELAKEEEKPKAEEKEPV